MPFKMKRSGVRFQLGPLLKSSTLEQSQTLLKDSSNSLQDAGRDSGAPSPDISPVQQPASLRLLHNQNRINILNSINDILKSRSELENSRSTLNRLHDDLRARLRSNTRENHAKKQGRLEQARLTVMQLSSERSALEGQLARMREHLMQHEREHAAHSGGVEDEQGLVVQTAPHGAKVDKKPSRKADQRLAAGRLLREVLQLRSRLAALERRLQSEARRKKQADDELSVLRAAVTRNKGKRIERAALKPLVFN